TAVVTEDYSYAAGTLARLAAQFGFEDRWAYCPRYLPNAGSAGLSKAKIVELYRHADAILNLCGAQELNEDLLQSERMIYIESDPGVVQIKVDQQDRALAEYLDRHRALFTFGENVGTWLFPVPTHTERWLPTRQPVVTDFWKTEGPPATGAVFTSVANWDTTGLKDIEWRGEKYLWSKSVEFLRFIEAPARAGETFELATTINDPATAERFRLNGWQIRSSEQLS